MKREIFINIFIFLSLLFIIGVSVAFGQDNKQITREGNTFIQTYTLQQSTDVLTEYFYTIKDKIYPIYITKNGRCYIVRISKNGNEYKQYLDENVARQICAEMNVEYKDNPSR